MKELTIKLKVWRQKNSKDKGRFVDYDVPGLNEHMSFLEMLDVCLLYTSPSPRDMRRSRMPSSA